MRERPRKTTGVVSWIGEGKEDWVGYVRGDDGRAYFFTFSQVLNGKESLKEGSRTTFTTFKHPVFGWFAEQIEVIPS